MCPAPEVPGGKESPTSEPASPTPKRPLVVAGLRNRRWESAASECHLTKGLLQNMKSFGYTKVRYLRFGETQMVEDSIEALLAIHPVVHR